MGLQIGDIVPRKEVSFSELKGKIIAVDALNAIYQFLSSIRQPDGTPLMDSSGRVTSHLSGLFYRNIALLSEGIRLVYVFDGEYHKLKEKKHEIRQGAKDIAREKYERAVEEEDVEAMGKYARGFTKVDSTMIAEKRTSRGYGNLSSSGSWRGRDAVRRTCQVWPGFCDRLAGLRCSCCGRKEIDSESDFIKKEKDKNRIRLYCSRDN